MAEDGISPEEVPKEVPRRVEELVATFHPPLDLKGRAELAALKPAEQLAILRTMRSLAQRRAVRLRSKLGGRTH